MFNYLYQIDSTICYWRDKREIDFVTQGSLVQVAYEIDNPKTAERELMAFNDFPLNKSSKDLITFDKLKPLGGCANQFSIDEYIFKSV